MSAILFRWKVQKWLEEKQRQLLQEFYFQEELERREQGVQKKWWSPGGGSQQGGIQLSCVSRQRVCMSIVGSFASGRGWWGDRLTKAHGFIIQIYRKSHTKISISKIHILRCMGSKFCVKFQRAHLKFHSKIWTHTLQNMHYTRC